jgi:hypothetical protein
LRCCSRRSSCTTACASGESSAQRGDLHARAVTQRTGPTLATAYKRLGELGLPAGRRREGPAGRISWQPAGPPVSMVWGGRSHDRPGPPACPRPQTPGGGGRALPRLESAHDPLRLPPPQRRAGSCEPHGGSASLGPQGRNSANASSRGPRL